MDVDSSEAPEPPDTAAAVAALRAADATADRLEVQVMQAEPDLVTVAMTVKAQDTNFLDMGHGGMMFTLADIAMSYVSNATARSLATKASIEFLAAVHPGDVLVATAEVINRQGRGSTVDCRVERGGETVALFRGNTLAVK